MGPLKGSVSISIFSFGFSGSRRRRGRRALGSLRRHLIFPIAASPTSSSARRTRRGGLAIMGGCGEISRWDGSRWLERSIDRWPWAGRRLLWSCAQRVCSVLRAVPSRAADEIERLHRAANAEDTVMLSPQARGGLDGLKIVRKVLRGHEPLIGLVLWVTRDHVASCRRACD